LRRGLAPRIDRALNIDFAELCPVSRPGRLTAQDRAAAIDDKDAP
jgi:hypothetical protein